MAGPDHRAQATDDLKIPFHSFLVSSYSIGKRKVIQTGQPWDKAMSFFLKTHGNNIEQYLCDQPKSRGGSREADANISLRLEILLMHFPALCWQGAGGNVFSQFISEGCGEACHCTDAGDVNDSPGQST